MDIILLDKGNAMRLATKFFSQAGKSEIRYLIIVITLIVISSCASTSTLMPTPNIYQSKNSYPESELKPDQKKAEIDMFYVTDRLPYLEKNQLEYSNLRSSSVGFGSALVEIGNQLSWAQLMKVSESRASGKSLKMTVGKLMERGRFPSTPHLFSVVDELPVEDPEIQ